MPQALLPTANCQPEKHEEKTANKTTTEDEAASKAVKKAKEEWKASPPEDMSASCCRAWGVKVSADRPCLFWRGLLTTNECAEILSTICSRHDTAPKSLDVGARSEFQHVNPTLSSLLWSRIQPHIPARLDGGTAVGLRASWDHARYFPGQAVFAHMDQRQTSAEHRADPTIASRITLNIYLDEDYKGAEFVFVTGTRDDGTWATTHTTLRPRAGDAVMFYQSVKEFSHAVPPLISGIKTILRSDVMYRFESAAVADVGARHMPAVS